MLAVFGIIPHNFLIPLNFAARQLVAAFVQFYVGMPLYFYKGYAVLVYLVHQRAPQIDVFNFALR